MRPGVALRALTRFRCVAAACEDTCCASWHVEVDPATHERLRALVEAAPASEERLGRALLAVVDGDERPTGAAMLAHTPGGPCHLLDEDRLCSLERRHGAALLPLGCATFPRAVLSIGGALELVGTLACPELARLLLVDGDGLDLVDADLDLLAPRAGLQQRAGDAGDEPYLAELPGVRAALLGVLDAPGRTLDERLFIAAWLAASLHPLHRRGAPAAAPGAVERQLAIALHPEAQEALAERFRALPASASAFGAVLETLRARVESDPELSPRFAALVGAAMAGCEADDDANDATTLTLPPPVGPRRIARARLAAAHAARRAALPAAAAARAEVLLARACRATALRRLHSDESDLFLYLQMLLVRLAVTRVLLLAQPRVDDAATVAVVQSVARAFEHDRLFSDRLADTIRGMGPQSPVHSALLLKL